MKIFGFLMFAVFFAFTGSSFADVRFSTPGFVNQGGVIKVVVRTDMGGQFANKSFFVSPDQRTQVEFNAIPKTMRGEYLILIPVAVEELPGYGNVCVETLKRGVCSPVEIRKINFPESKKVFFVKQPTAAISARYAKEREFLDAVYAKIVPERYFSENLIFGNPLEIMAVVKNADFGQIRKKAMLSPGGKKVASRWKDHHKGIDLLAPSGAPVFAAESGRVAAARNLLGSGNTIIIDHGYGLLSLYFHLSRILVSEGDVVGNGQKIGLVGKSGNAEGAHLHFEIRLSGIPVNPKVFLKSGGAE